MNIQELFAPGKIVSFELYPSHIYGAISNMTSMGVVTYDIARRLAHDPESQHIQVYPTLPEGTPDDPTKYNYVMLSKGNERPVPIGIPWIKLDTVKVSSKFSYIVTIEHDQPDQEKIIEEVLNANGFMSTHVRVES